MKKGKNLFLCIFVVFAMFLMGCEKVNYSDNFDGIPVYSQAQLLMEDGSEEEYIEMYIIDSSNEDFGDIVSYYEDNINSEKWEVEEVDRIAGSGIDEITGYKLIGENKEVDLTITKSDDSNTITINIIGDKS